MTIVDTTNIETDEEVWVEMKGYKGNYLASSLGIIKSVDRWIKHPKSSTGFNKVAGRVLKPHLTNSGYKYVNLHVDTVYDRQTIHRLIANNFIPNPENKEQVNHKNGIKTDNRVVNLEWATRSENGLHSNRVLGSRKRTYYRGKENSRSVPVLQYSINGEFIKEWESLTLAGAQNNNRIAISYCCNGVLKTSGGFKWKFKK